MSIETPFFRVRWMLCARSAWTLHSHQNAMLYALLCDAARGNDVDRPSYMPEGLLLDAPEQCRDRYERGDLFAFGATLIDFDPASALRRLHAISEGLARVGHVAPRKPIALGGNFDLVNVQDLVAKRSLAPGEPFMALGLDPINNELERLYAMAGQPLTLRFHSPLRLERPGSEAQSGHRYADAAGLHAGQFLRTVQKRLATIGLRRRDQDTGSDIGADAPFDDSAITLLANRLTWLDLEYGRRDDRKALGGALGRITVAIHDKVAIAALMWGQYARVGKNLHFGFGRYRIEELGPDPTECQRVRPLLDLCLSPPAIAHAAAEHDLEPEAFRRAAEELRAGTYHPGPAYRVVLRSADGEPRELRVPPIADRALQRLILARLGPALDRLFETSSFAWRRGLNRASAARRIERLVSDGWHFAVRADFDRFFDRVPKQLARDRLEACLGDDRATAAVWSFVDAEMPGDVGIPTGAPLSPLLGNLLLDQFDEAIENEGGRLVRYADDFLIFTRRCADAERLHVRAQELAADLLLQLNADSAVIEVREPFDFLGYRFRHEERWQYAGPSGPRRVQELGWKDADRSPSLLALGVAPRNAPPGGCGCDRGRAGDHASRCGGRLAQDSRPKRERGQGHPVEHAGAADRAWAGWLEPGRSRKAPSQWSSGPSTLRRGLANRRFGERAARRSRGHLVAMPGCRRPGECPALGASPGSGQAAELRSPAGSCNRARRSDRWPAPRAGGRMHEGRVARRAARVRRVGRGCVVSAAPLASRQGIFVSSARRPMPAIR